MRYWYRFVFLALGLPAQAGAQSVGIGTASPASSAALEVSSTSKGLLLPRLTTAQMNAVSQPVPGLLVYNTTENKFYGYGIGSTPGTIAQTGQGASFPITNGGQSFTVGGLGLASALTFYLYNAATTTVTEVVTVNLYAGAGISGTLLSTQTRSVTLATTTLQAVTVSFPTGLWLAAGQQYTFSVNYGNTALFPAGSSTDTYAGGILYSGTAAFPNFDLAFRLEFLPGQWAPLN
ncbi:hypothetical protein [Hymenobacter koreensis]|uniref:DUF4082 domain-containing protein n=1 Tax=Hymenobacter koreensis TaxID=1084523 RepID=A0ABP8JNW0_9BACT